MDTQVIEDAIPHVRAIAYQYFKRCHRHRDIDDIVQDGAVGLLQAASRFDASKGVSFRTWTSSRVRGAIIDAARVGSGYSRHRGVPHVAWSQLDGRDRMPGSTPVDALTSAWLQRALKALPVRERYILLAYYYAEIPQPVIARRLGLSENGVNYLRNRALARMAA